jgi:oligopeptide/dipeptide ABC transporter ATP-binding protein
MRWKDVMPPGDAALLMQVKGLKVGYPVGKQMVTPIDGLDFEIREREVVGLLGDAGSGKSSAALALLGLTRPPGRILAGEVNFLARNLLALPPEEQRAIRGKQIGLIVQNPRGALHPMLPVGRQIGNAYRAHAQANAAEGKRRAIDLLRKVGINDPERRADAYAHELSGGMAQRALISMALASNPQLLIADEPTSGLDVTIQAQLLDEMAASVRQTGSAILLVTQDLGIIAHYCDRVLVLHEGRIVESAETRSFFERPQHSYSQSILSLRRSAIETSGIAPEEPPLIEVNNLVKHFPIKGSAKVVQAVDGVSLSIRPGESVGLVGESGSGKTSVGRCLLRLTEPTSGAITYRGEAIAGIAQRAMRRFRAKLQIVFQDPYDALNPRFSIEKVIREPLDLHSTLDAAARRRRIAELLELVGLDPSRMGEKPRGLGAGALQRLNIARALATDPEFIVLDEPTSVLSPIALVGFIDLLARLKRELGLAYLFISHDLTTVRHVCDRVAVMYLGQIVEIGTTKQIFETPAHPYAQALLSAHLEPDPTRRRRDRTDIDRLEGEIPSPIDLPRGCYLASRCRHVADACRITPQKLQPFRDGRSVRCMRVIAGEVEPGGQHVPA